MNVWFVSYLAAFLQLHNYTASNDRMTVSVMN